VSSAELLSLADTCLLPSFQGHTLPDWTRRRLAGGLGGVVLFAFNIADHDQLARLCADMRSENPDVLIGVDEEGGDVTRLHVATGSPYPGNLALGVVDDVELTRSVAAQIAADLASVGVNLNLAPDADVNSNPDNPVIGVRAFGAEPKLVAAHTAAYVDGLQSSRVAACAKHFPGHGDTVVDSHHGLPIVHDDIAALRSGALLPFQAAIEAGVASIMTAHLLLPAYDDVPATVSRRILTGLLRDELGFDGLIMTDALDMQGVKGLYGIADSGVRALAAGADALCGGPEVTDENTEALRQAIVAAVAGGRLDEARLAEAAGRVRSLAAWAHPRAGSTGDRSVGLSAARRAIRASGVSVLTAPPYVLELEPPWGMAVGPDTVWGLGQVLAGALPGTEMVRMTGPPQTLAELLGAASGRPLVVVSKDAHRHGWVAQTEAAVLAARPDAVIVEMGLPDGVLAAAGPSIATHGAARANAVAAAEVLLGRTL
jgi:beta-N-acetylhexosaminidase